jgi:hypothetical protein
MRYENAKFHSENFIAQECKKVGLAFQILRQVLLEENARSWKPIFHSKYMVFIS